MKFNICVVRPNGYIHSAAFTELAELVGYGLQDLGHTVALNINRIVTEATNIIIGCHLFGPSVIDQVPKSSIVINTEQIYADETIWNKNIFQWVSRFETWDYSEKNLIRLKEIGAKNVKLLRIGYHKNLARIAMAENQDIDVLFYGSMVDRRRKIIESLQSSGCNVKVLFGVYGRERDALIARSKVILNIHQFKSQIFEIVRVFYLMTNAKAVVGEIGETTAIDRCYSDGIYSSRYEDLVDACKKLVRDKCLRRELEKTAVATIMKLPQHELLTPLLS